MDDDSLCTYLGSFPVTISNAKERARYIAQQLENILRNRQTSGTPVSVKLALCGIQVTSPSTNDVYMTHALRRVSFSTCLPSLFAFAARDPGQALNKQFCHVFHTSQAEELNAEIGGAFNSAYTLHRGDGASSVASHYSESVQRGGGGGGGELMSGRQSRSSTSPPSQPSAASARQRAQTEPDQRSTDTFRYVYDYQPNISESHANPMRKISSDSDDVFTSPNPGPGYVTVCSKTSNKSNDSAISSLADELERRVMQECQRQESTSTSSHHIHHHQPHTRHSKPNYDKLRPAANNDKIISRLADSQDSSGYSSMGSMMSQLTISGAEKMKLAFNKYKTNPVAKKLKVLAPGDHYHELDARLKTADWYHKGLPKEVGISVLGGSTPGTFLVLPQTLLLRGYEHVHEYSIINENKIGWYLKGSSRAFPHLLMLVAHYQSHLDILPLQLTAAPIS